MPPKGVGRCLTFSEFTQTIPASIAWATRWARPTSRVQMYRETEMNVVGNLDRFGLVGEWNHGEHRPEYLFLSDPHPRGRIREQRREDVVASTFPRAPPQRTDALTPRDRTVAQDLLSVPLMDQRSDLGVRIERVADLDTPRACREGRRQIARRSFVAPTPGWMTCSARRSGCRS